MDVHYILENTHERLSYLKNVLNFEIIISEFYVHLEITNLKTKE